MVRRRGSDWAGQVETLRESRTQKAISLRLATIPEPTPRRVAVYVRRDGPVLPAPPEATEMPGQT
jgi:hypothetical protein